MRADAETYNEFGSGGSTDQEGELLPTRLEPTAQDEKAHENASERVDEPQMMERACTQQQQQQQTSTV